jgi:hypothetical protein
VRVEEEHFVLDHPDDDQQQEWHRQDPHDSCRTTTRVIRTCAPTIVTNKNS